MFVALRISDYIINISRDWQKSVLNINFENLLKENTYISIFSPGYEHHLTTLKKCKEIQILFESERAINSSRGHGQFPRNTLVVFELKDEPLLETHESVQV